MLRGSFRLRILRSRHRLGSVTSSTLQHPVHRAPHSLQPFYHTLYLSNNTLPPCLPRAIPLTRSTAFSRLSSNRELHAVAVTSLDPTESDPASNEFTNAKELLQALETALDSGDLQRGSHILNHAAQYPGSLALETQDLKRIADVAAHNGDPKGLIECLWAITTSNNLPTSSNSEEDVGVYISTQLKEARQKLLSQRLSSLGLDVPESVLERVKRRGVLSCDYLGRAISAVMQIKSGHKQPVAGSQVHSLLSDGDLETYRETGKNRRDGNEDRQIANLQRKSDDDTDGNFLIQNLAEMLYALRKSSDMTAPEWGLMLTYVGRRIDSEKAGRWMTELVSKGAKPSLELYGDLYQAHKFNLREDKARVVWKLMCQSGLDPDRTLPKVSYLYKSRGQTHKEIARLIEAAPSGFAMQIVAPRFTSAENDDLGFLKYLFQTEKEDSESYILTAIEAYHKKNELKGMSEMFLAAADAGIRPTRRVVEKLLNSYAKIGHMQSIEVVSRVAIDQNLLSEVQEARLRLKSACEANFCGNAERAVRDLISLKSITEEDIDRAFRAFERNNDSRRATNLLRWSHRLGYGRSQKQYHNLIRLARRNRNLESIDHIVQEMKSEGFEPTEETYFLLMQAFSDLAERERVESLIQEMKEKKIDFGAKHAVLLARFAEDSKTVINIPEFAYDLCRRQSGKQHNMLYDLYIAAYIRRGHYKHALRMIELMLLDGIKLRPSTFFLLSRAFDPKVSYETIRRWLDALDQRGVIVKELQWPVIFWIFDARWRLEEGRKMYLDMIKSGVHCTKHMLVPAVRLAIKVKDFDNAEDMLHKAMEDRSFSVHDFNNILNAAVTVEAVPVVLFLVKEMQKRQIQYNRYTYSELFRFQGAVGTPQALQSMEDLVKEMETRGLRPSALDLSYLRDLSLRLEDGSRYDFWSAKLYEADYFPRRFVAAEIEWLAKTGQKDQLHYFVALLIRRQSDFITDKHPILSPGDRKFITHVLGGRAMWEINNTIREQDATKAALNFISAPRRQVADDRGFPRIKARSIALPDESNDIHTLQEPATFVERPALTERSWRTRKARENRIKKFVTRTTLKDLRNRESMKRSLTPQTIEEDLMMDMITSEGVLKETESFLDSPDRYF